MKTAEDRLVQKVTKALEPKNWAGLVMGAGDDAALLKPRPSYQTIVTCDWFLEGSHFLRNRHSPESIGWKCLARAISDVAAMGGQPLFFLLSLALPESHSGKWLDGFLKGLESAARRFDCRLAGGDTTRNREILINVTVTGEVPSRQAVLRSGAKPGDLIFVSGRLGEAELGLRSLRRESTTDYRNRLWIKKHLYPEPRVALGRWLAGKRLATAMMDLSDGLSTDLSRLCAASRVGARITIDKIPKVKLPKGKGRGRYDMIELALHGGDDYELLFTIRPGKRGQLPSAFHGLPLSYIGEITREGQVISVGPGGHQEKLVAHGWDPF
jgi:thiamine-monophosphate kinase